MQIRLLGGIGVTDDGQPVEVGPPKCQAVLAALALSVGEAVPVHRLVDLVWGEASPATAERTLQSYVTRLRKALGPEAIDRVGAAYRLALPDDAVDVIRFQRFLASGNVESALGEWKGRPLVGLDALGFAPIERGLVEQWLGATETQLEHQVQDEPGAAIGRLIELSAEYPLREGLWRLLMLALYRVGRQADALAAYRRARHHLVEELGVEPGPQLRELESLILAQDRRLQSAPPLTTGVDDHAGSADLPTGAVTFLFTDIEGSTPLWDRHPTAMRQAVERHDAILHDEVDRQHGHVISTTGDGLAVVFSRPSDALTAAIGAQRRLLAEAWPEPTQLTVRMGLHSGEAQERDRSYYGPAVNCAARLMAAANGGQIVLSALTAELCQRDDDVQLVDLGHLQLTGMSDAVHAFGASADGVPWPDRPLMTTRSSTATLPLPRTELVGDLARLRRRTERLADLGLVTLTGAGGVGKTRASIEIGWLVADDFVDGVWFVELAPVSDPDGVVATLASTMSVPSQPDMTLLESLVDWCRGRRMLLIVDNCEHVLAATADAVAAISASCPTVTILTTSREPLRIEGEHVVRVPSLDIEQGVELFCLRASAGGAFSAADADTYGGSLLAICEQLDGIPLAIELAAARTRALTPVEILERLRDSSRLLHDQGRGRPERHQTLRATMAWSYDLLPGPDRELFARLSVFSGSFDLAAAEAVCAGDGIEEPDVVDLIAELVDKSMVVARSVGPHTRFRVLEILRQFGEERLGESQDPLSLRERHLDHYTSLVERAHVERMSPRQVETDAWFDQEWDNIRAAHAWAISSGNTNAGNRLVLATVFHAQDRLRHEHRAWTDRTVALAERSGGCPASTYAVAAMWSFVAAEPARTIELAEKGIEHNPSDPALALCYSWLVYGLGALGRFDEAIEAFGRLRLAHEAADDPFVRYVAMMTIVDAQEGMAGGEADITAFVELCEAIGGPTELAKAREAVAIQNLYADDPPDFEGATAAFNDMIEITGRADLAGLGAWGRAGTAAAAVLRRAPDASHTVLDALGASYDGRYWLAVVHDLEIVALHLAQSGRAEAAAKVLGHLELDPPLLLPTLQIRERTLAALDPVPAVDAWKAQGATLSRPAVVAYAMDQLSDSEAGTGGGRRSAESR